MRLLSKLLFIIISFTFSATAQAGRDLASLVGPELAKQRCALVSSFISKEDNFPGGGLATLHPEDSSDGACIKECDEMYKERVDGYGPKTSGRCRFEGQYIKTYGNGPFVIPHKDGGFFQY